MVKSFTFALKLFFFKMASSITVDKIKAWAAPILFSSVTWLLWQDISEMKSDVKKILAESEYRKAKIETIEEDVKQLKQSVYYNKKTAYYDSNNKKNDNLVKIQSMYFINEDIYRLRKKTIPQQQI